MAVNALIQTSAWEQQRLGDLGEFNSNGVDKLSKPDELPVFLLNYMDVYNRREITAKNCNELMHVTARKEQLKNNNILANDIFFTPTSETPEDIGHVYVIKENLPNTVYSYHLMRFRPKHGSFYSTFPNYVFDTDVFRREMTFAAQGVQRYVISKPAFESLKVYVPSLREQEKIANMLSSLDSLLTLRQREQYLAIDFFLAF